MRPNAQSVRALALVAVLLVSAVAVPIAAAQPAAAQPSPQVDWDDDFLESCTTNARFAYPGICGLATPDITEIDSSQSTSIIKTDIHVGAQGTYESGEQFASTYRNYLEDTSTLAALEARHAIATSYESNESATEAQAAATGAVNDYYAMHERQILEVVSAHSAELAYYSNASIMDPDIADEFVHGFPVQVSDGFGDGGIDGPLAGETHNSSWTLVNGSTHEYELATLNQSRIFEPDFYEFENTVESEWNLSTYNESGNHFDLNVHWDRLDNDNEGNRTGQWKGLAVLLNHPDAGLDSQIVYDYRQFVQMLKTIDEQAQTVQNAFPQSLAEDMYAAMDSGALDPNEVRGAQGMVRYLSGDATGGDALNIALRHALDLEHPDDLGARMVVSTDGVKANPESNVSTAGDISWSYTTLENQSLDGLMFASGFPNSTAHVGQTYDAANLSHVSILTGSGEFVFDSGNFTVDAIYNADGESVDSMTFSGPGYGTYNATDYIQALEDASNEREKIIDDGGGGGGIELPGWWPDGTTIGEAAFGVLAVVGVGAVVLTVIRR
ncbi:hypothetical protein ACFOUR_18565 [Halovivax cerinus]|uniref:Envelope protein N-terminal domain-containing protein n=1 Tax=Halovivax cerinus TaxID=1487865 RepID=A0ABD5NTV1_9EURY